MYGGINHSPPYLLGFSPLGSNKHRRTSEEVDYKYRQETVKHTVKMIAKCLGKGVKILTPTNKATRRSIPAEKRRKKKNEEKEKVKKVFLLKRQTSNEGSGDRYLFMLCKVVSTVWFYPLEVKHLIH